MMNSVMGRGNQYIQLVKFRYRQLLTIGKKLPIFQHSVRGLNCKLPGRQVLLWPPEMTTEQETYKKHGNKFN